MEFVDANEGWEAEQARAKRRGRPRRSGRLMPMWILLGAAVIVAAVWFVSEEMGGTEEAVATVPLIAAREGPIKIRPDEPGGLDVPNRDKYVYKSLTTDEPESGPEQLLPPPEEPMAKPEAPAEALREVSVNLLSEDEPEPEAPGLTVDPAAEMESALAELAPASQTVTGQDSFAEVPESAVAVLAPKPAEPKPAEPKPVKPKPVKAEPAEPASALSSGSGEFLIQIAAARSEDGARREWRRLKERHGEVLGALSLTVVRADLGDKGIWYRVRVGPFVEKSRAANVCAKLKAEDVGCFVANR